MCFTNNRLTGLRAAKTLLGSTRLSRVQLKNKLKLLLCKFDRGDYGCLCGKGDQRSRRLYITKTIPGKLVIGSVGSGSQILGSGIRNPDPDLWIRPLDLNAN